MKMNELVNEADGVSPGMGKRALNWIKSIGKKPEDPQWDDLVRNTDRDIPFNAPTASDNAISNLERSIADRRARRAEISNPVPTPVTTDYPNVWRTNRTTPSAARDTSWLDDIDNTAGGKGLNPPVEVPKVEVPKASVEAPKRKRLTKDEQLELRRQREIKQAEHEAKLEKIRKGEADKAKADADEAKATQDKAAEQPRADEPKAAEEPKVDNSPASDTVRDPLDVTDTGEYRPVVDTPAEAPRVDTPVAVDDPAEIARLSQSLQDRLAASRPKPEPELTPKQRLEKAHADLENAQTLRAARDAEREIARLNADPVETPANNAPANNAPSQPASTISVEQPPTSTEPTFGQKVKKELMPKDGAGATAAALKGLGYIGAGEVAGRLITGGESPIGLAADGIDWAKERMRSKTPKPTAADDVEDLTPDAGKASKAELDKYLDSKLTPAAPASAPQQESISTILKLSGQRPITERDNTVGITKPRAIRTLTESTNLAECGMGSPSYSQPASFSINASAGSGDEVANMLKSIMHLAGVKPVTGDMLGAEMLPQVHDMDIISASPEMMGMPEMDHDDMGHADVIEIDGVMGDHDQEEEVGEEYDNTPHPQVDTEDPLRKWANVVNKNDMSTIPPGAPGDNKLQSTLNNEPVREATDVHSSLLKAYEAFKNS
jgi:hypothetical protein